MVPEKRSRRLPENLRIAGLVGTFLGALLLVVMQPLQVPQPLPRSEDISLLDSHGVPGSKTMPLERMMAREAGEEMIDQAQAAPSASRKQPEERQGGALQWSTNAEEAAAGAAAEVQAEGDGDQEDVLSGVDAEADEDEAAEIEGVSGRVGAPVRLKEVAPARKAENLYSGVEAGGRAVGPMCGGIPEAWLPSPEMAEARRTPSNQRRRLQQRIQPSRNGDLVLPREDEEQWLRANLEATAAWGAGEEEQQLEGALEVEELEEELGEEWPFRPSSWGGAASRSLKGFTVMGAGCAKTKQYKVGHENDGAGALIGRNVKPSEKPLIDCLKNPRKCGPGAKRVARMLPGIKVQLAARGKLKVAGLAQAYGLGKKSRKSCALVGNAGHLSKRHYGSHIDSHDVVVRFNVQKAAEFSAYVGDKTSLRVVNHRRSLAMCCRGNWPEARAGVASSGMMLWFPAAQDEIMSECKKRFPKNPRFIFPNSVISAEVRAMNMMRRDLSRLGFGPFEDWKQMTSGSHAALLFSTMCDSVSLFGFTTYGDNSAGGADQYAAAIMRNATGGKGTKLGATQKARSGEKWHDWKGEKFVLRLLHAAGLINICSM